MENFFGRLKVEMFYGEKFESVNTFVDDLRNYIDYERFGRDLTLEIDGGFTLYGFIEYIG